MAVCSPADDRVYTAGADTTILAWHSLPAQWRQIKNTKVSRLVLMDKWNALMDPDARTGLDAIKAFVLEPTEGVKVLGERLRPAPVLAAADMESAIENLDSSSFQKRAVAVELLKKAERQAEPALRRALLKDRSLESKRRIESLLNALPSAPLEGEPLRQTRAIQALEWAGTDAARQLILQLTKGAPGAVQTEAAVSALARFKKKH
jgi:hypothetical protein